MADEITETSQTVAAGQLRAFIERIEEEKKTIADDFHTFCYVSRKGFRQSFLRDSLKIRYREPS